jgi:hypothetical protein
MLLEVKKAVHIKDYNLLIQFNDGVEGMVDLKSTIFNDKRTIFSSLKNVDFFKNFFIALNTICWNNDLDLAPEYLKEKMVEQNGVKDA